MNDFVVKNGVEIGGSFKGAVGTVTGNATLDLSTGDAFEVVPTADVTFAFSNPPAAGNAQAFSVALTGADIGVSYDIANAVYDSVSFSVAGQTSDARGVTFNVDGTKMYMLESTNTSVHQYSLSSPFDLSTATYDAVSFNISAQETSPRGITFNNNGTKMYISGGATSAVYQYSLSTAFDLSTATYDNVSLSSFRENDVVFSADGTKMFGVEFSIIYQYSLSTAFDLSTATYDNISFNVGLQEIEPQGLAFSSNGNKMFVLGYNSDSVHQYSLSTPFNLSAVVYDSISFSVSAQMNWPLDLTFSPNGTKMYALSQVSPPAVYQYSTGVSDIATFTYPTSVKFPNGTAPTSPADGVTDVLNFVTDDGGNTYHGFKVGEAFA